MNPIKGEMMPKQVNRKVVLKSYPQGPLKESDFDIVDEEIGDIAPGSVLVRVDLLSIDAFIRTTLDGGGFHTSAQLGGVVPALGAGTVVESADPSFSVGDTVTGPFCSQSYAMMPAVMLRKLDTSIAPASAFLGALGMATGLTSYTGIVYVGKAKPGDTVVISGAAGAVGSMAGQVARLSGATTVIGIAGGKHKVDFLVNELGYSAAIDYRNENVEKRLAELAPNGVDLFFDNVGGEVLDSVLMNIAEEARVVLCGAVSQYENMADVRGPKNYLKIPERNASMLGFTIFHYAHKHAEAEAQMGKWLKSGELKVREQIEEGIENFPATVRMLLDGGHYGKLMLRVH